MLLTFAIFLIHLLWLQPRMDRALEEFRAAALAGSNTAATAAQERFDGLHPTASRLLSATTLSALVLFGVAAWTASGMPRRSES
ncbi:MAG: hypothetical protein IPJ41_13810 [Phycisphaerales bacterium]|nr:hypothetical protein [Phycisphaerales bacterium]